MNTLFSVPVRIHHLSNPRMKGIMKHGYGIDVDNPRLEKAIIESAGRMRVSSFASWLGRNGYSDCYDDSEMGEWLRRETRMETCEAAGVCLFEWGSISQPCIDCDLGLGG